MMENAEEILHCLDEYAKVKPKDIPRELEEYLCFVARTGDPVYQWSLIKTLFREKLLSVITDFYETCPTVEIPPCPNVETFNYDVMKTFILEKLESFAAAPFTVQRICELLTTPRKEYNRIDKYMRALEKNILVVSTREPGPQNRRSTENGDDISMLNGLENDSTPNVLSNDGHIEVDMEEAPIWSPKSLALKNVTQIEENTVKPTLEVAQEETAVTEEVPKTEPIPETFSPLPSTETPAVEAAQIDDIPIIEAEITPSISEETEQPPAHEVPEMEITAASEEFTATAEATPTDIFIEQAKLENEDEATGQETYFSIISADVTAEETEIILPTDEKKVEEKEMVIDKIPEEVKEEVAVEEEPVVSEEEVKDEKELMEAMTLEKEVIEETEPATEVLQTIEPEVKIDEPEPVEEESPEMEGVEPNPTELPKTEIEPIVEESKPIVEEEIPKEVVEQKEEEPVEEEALSKLETNELVAEEKSVETVPEDSPKIEISPPDSEESSSPSIPPTDESSQ